MQSAPTPHAGWAIIIPHYDDHVRLERCLDALMKNDLDNCDIVVVDNGSSLPPLDIIDRFGRVRLVTERTPGAAAARNRGVAETSAPVLFFLDADCIPSNDWVTVGKAKDPRGGIIGGRIHLFDEDPGPRSGAQAFEQVFAFKQERAIYRSGYSVTANLVTTREVFEVTGPMRSGVAEDVDWCRRATAKGFDLCYAPDLVVAHPTRRDWDELQNKWNRVTAEGFALFDEAHTKAYWLLRALAMPISIVFHTPRVLRTDRLNSTRERWLALKTLTRLRLQRSVWMIRQVCGRTIT